MIVFAFEYPSEKVSKSEYDRFDAWSRREDLAVSTWRVSDPDETTWCIVVVDESGRALGEFDWSGQPVTLPLGQAIAFIERRVSRLVGAYRAGKRSRVDEHAHYGPAIAPRLRANGVWEMPARGQG